MSNVYKENIVMDIFYNPYQYNLAKNVNSYFNGHNIATHMMTDVNELLFFIKNQKYKKHILVILSYTRLSPIIFPKLSDNKYVIFQLENLIENINIHKYLELFQNAMYVYDYNSYNLKYYDIQIQPKVHNFTPPIYTKDSIDILFYGTLNERRNKILNEIKKKFNITIVTKVFGEPLNELIKKSKIVLNISYYNNSLLENTRINECLQNNTTIISELPKLNRNDMYNDNVIFIQPIQNDYSEITNKIENILIKYSIVKDINDKFHEVMNNTILNYFNEQKYKLLFHKINLNCVRVKPMNYVVEKSELYSKSLFAHLHCYDISQFTTIYKDYIYDLSKYFHIIVTYTIGYLDKKNEYITLLKIPNNGYDIGAKMMMVKYLKDKNIDYKYIYFMHSKSDINLRHIYFDTLYDHVDDIVKYIEDYDGYFPNLLYKLYNQYNIKQSNKIKQPDYNYVYTNELKHYLNVKDTQFNTFVEGNVYILRRNICETIFGDERLYRLLNESDENDYVHLQNIYRKPLEEIYHKLKYNYQTKMIHDGQLEHAFERVVLSLCDTYKVVKPILNILVKNGNQIKHILEQDYDVQIICTDYLNRQDYVNVKYVQESKFQDMLQYVTSGWILFLEEDYRYNNKNALFNLSQYLYNHSNIIKVNIPGVNHLTHTNIIIHNTIKWDALYIDNIRKNFTEINEPFIIKI